jgi:hypothetical protein
LEADITQESEDDAGREPGREPKQRMAAERLWDSCLGHLGRLFRVYKLPEFQKAFLTETIDHE